MESRYQPIENHGVIGNMRTVALVAMDGSIDWWCYPDFDSPSVFGAILDSRKGGAFRIFAQAERVVHRQLSWPETNILVTRFLLSDGIAELEDFMPVGDAGSYHRLCRRVRCVKGEIRISLYCRPSFNYGRDGPYLAAVTQILNSVGALTLVYAFRYGKAIVVSPLTNAGAPLITALLALALLGLVPQPLKIAGIVLAFVAAALLAIEPEEAT